MSEQEKAEKRERLFAKLNRIGKALHAIGLDLETVLEKLAVTCETAPGKIKKALRFL